MQGKYILPVLLLILVLIPPSGASLTKITPGSPVFIGETNIDITRPLDNCRIIGWWPEGTERTFPATKNITLRPLNEVSSTMSHYTFSPAEYSNYTGTWYCEERRPFKEVFTVIEPQITIRAWDADRDQDVTGMTVPATANVTYRIDTNTDSALQVKYRPDVTPADGFWTIKLTDPHGLGITNIYTGSFGAKNTVILSFDNKPYITSSPYLWNFWKHGGIWDHTSRNKQGDLIYSPGTYTFTAEQNLNGMQGVYKSAGITDLNGKMTSSAQVMFEEPVIAVGTATPAPTPGQTGAEVTPAVSSEPTRAESTPVPPVATTTPVPVKTTYQPLPPWIALAGLGIAAVVAAWQRK